MSQSLRSDVSYSQKGLGPRTSFKYREGGSILSVSLLSGLDASLSKGGKRDKYGARVSTKSLLRLSADSIQRPNDLAVNKLEAEEEKHEEHAALLAVPDGWGWKTLHCLTLPLKYFFHFTIPDILDEANRSRYGITIFACVVWLALLAEAMLECLAILGNLFGISPAVMGLTFSAIGTSLPNIWASMIVARRGNGDMAIAAALGANTFNIYIGLGVPYLVYTLVNGQPYDSLKDEGIVLLILMLALIMVIWFVIIMLCNWEMRYW